MRQPRTHSGSSLFLMELILAILFFSVASAVCVQLFARAHTAVSYTHLTLPTTPYV